jgi:hypothetical protein
LTPGRVVFPDVPSAAPDYQTTSSFAWTRFMALELRYCKGWAVADGAVDQQASGTATTSVTTGQAGSSSTLQQRQWWDAQLAQTARQYRVSW